MSGYYHSNRHYNPVYKNKFKVGDIICIQDSLAFSYWSLPIDGTFYVRATQGWNKIQISNVATGEAYQFFYNTKHFKFKEKLMSTFSVGDIVTWSEDGTSGWQGTRSSTLQRSTNYIITASAVDGTSGKTKYKVDRAHKDPATNVWGSANSFGYKNTWYAERHFQLKEKGTTTVANPTAVKAIILNEQGNTVATISTHDAACNVLIDEKDVQEAINTKVGELLRKNPTQVFRVFEYTKTGKLPVLTPVWE